MAKASTEDLEKALTAGFDRKEIKLDPAAELEDNTPAAIDELAAAATDTDLENKPPAEIKDDVDEWEGFTPAMRLRMETLSGKLEKVTNIANSASGRANKLQSLLDKQANETPIEKPVLTSEQLLSAMTNKVARDGLREEFGEFAAALDEIDQSVSTSVGSAMDKLKAEMREEAKAISNMAHHDFEIKRTLDINHPGWETTVQAEEFKTWVYEGGPSKQEGDYYDSLVYQANQAAPEDSAALYDNANNYFAKLIEENPIWANEKGNLFGSASGDSANEMLNLYATERATEETASKSAAEIAAQQENLFEANITPTSGQQRQAPTATTDAAEKAFLDGYEN